MASGILSSRYPSRVVLPAALCGMAAVSILKTYAWSPGSFMALQVLHALPVPTQQPQQQRSRAAAYCSSTAVQQYNRAVP